MIFNAIPSAMSIMAATEQNEAPTTKKAYSYTSGVYERATSVKKCTAAKLTTLFADNEGNTTDNLTMYIREDVDWLDVTYSSGNITPNVKYTGDVDNLTDIVFPVECIDKNGASTMSTATIRITPRIYKPTIDDSQVIIYTDSVLVDTLSVGNIFTYPKSTTNLTFVTNVSNVSDYTLINSAEIDQNNNLVITAMEGVKGEAAVELTQTITHKTYGSKTFTATIPVAFESKVPSGIDCISNNNIDINYVNGVLTINNCKGERCLIYNVAGSLIYSCDINSNNFSILLNLNNDIYIVTTDNQRIKIAVK